jgi:DNA polymerase-4
VTGAIPAGSPAAADPTIIHVDMDAFYASVEQRDHPALRGRPVIVGGHARRGVVLAASYEVRPFGVKSAMSMVEALRRAPDAVVVPPRFAAYSEASETLFAILGSVTPLVEPLSLDEAFLDVAASRALFGDAATIATRLRDRIARELDLPASAGVATVKFVAKIASDVAKPNGLRVVPGAETQAFLGPLPVGRLWGVGRKTEEVLRRLGLHTIGELGARDPEWLERRVPGSRGLWELAQGIDPRAVVPDRAAKSLGTEDTFEEDCAADPGVLGPHIHAQALRLARRMRRAGVRGRVVQLKIKTASFALSTRRLTLAQPTDDGQTLYRVAMTLLERSPPHAQVRLTGVSVQGLSVTETAELELFAPPSPSRAEKLNAALDRITARFGDRAVGTADLPAAGTRVTGDDDREREL